MILMMAIVALLAAPPQHAPNKVAPGAVTGAGAGTVDSDRRSRSVKQINSCGPLRQRDTEYVLQQDVLSPGTCFSVEGDDIALDLNGHAVTYATAEGSTATFGVLAVDCWYKTISNNPCGGSHKRPIVRNGKIVQGPAAAPMSHALRFGQANNLTGITVHDLDITVSAPDSIAIYSEYLPGGSNIYRNTIHNNVKVISNRHQFYGTSIKLDEEKDAKLPDLIHDNIIIGGPHTGIRSDNPAGTRIYRNDISQDTNYTNGFCIDAAGEGMEVSDNTCHPAHGRGIHTNASGVKIFKNTVESIDSNKDEEYHGCEIHGTYGIQVESDKGSPSNIEVYGNHVKVHAAECPAEAMRLTDIKDAAVKIYDNTFIAVQDNIGPGLSDKGARGFSVGNVTGGHLEFTHNIVQADTAIFHMDWDSGGDITLKDNQFLAGARGAATLLAEFENGVGPSRNNIFENNTIEGFSASSSKFGEYAGDTSYTVTSDITVHVEDQSGQSLAGANLQAPDSEQTATSNASGEMRLVLPVIRVENKHPVQRYGPKTLTVSRPGCEVEQIRLSQPPPRTIRSRLVCQGDAN